jgi:hypothetical protein
MSIFTHRKPVEGPQFRDKLVTLRETLEQLEAEPEATQRITNLKQIIAARIAELEQKSA